MSCPCSPRVLGNPHLLSDHPNLGRAQPVLTSPLSPKHRHAQASGHWTVLPSPAPAHGHGSSQASLPTPSLQLHRAGTGTAVSCSQSHLAMAVTSPTAPSTQSQCNSRAVPAVVLSRHRSRQACASAKARGAPPPQCDVAELWEGRFSEQEVNWYLLSKPVAHFSARLSFISPVCCLKNSAQKADCQGPNQSRVQIQIKGRRLISGGSCA